MELKEVKNINFLLAISCMISIMFMTIGYAAYNSELSISGDAAVVTKGDIEITDISINAVTEGSYEVYNNEHTKNTVSFYVNLVDKNSYAIFDVEITNKHDTNCYTIKDVLTNIYSNNNVSYEIIDATSLSIDPGDVVVVQIKFYYNNNITSDTIINSEFEFIFGEVQNLAETIIENNGGLEFINSKEQPIFNEITSINEGLYKTADVYGDSYYFRGAVDNNWVILGKEGGQDIYWKIVRIDGAGNIKLIYFGTTKPSAANNVTNLVGKTSIGNSAFNTSYTKLEDVGYKYTVGELHGTSTDSIIKTAVDEWYTANLKDEYEKYLSSTIYCIDRSSYTDVTGNVANETYNNTNHFMGSYIRTIINDTPSLVCPNQNDEVSLNIGLISADEVLFAGLSNGTVNYNNYLYSREMVWTITPSAFLNGFANAIYLSYSGSLDSYPSLYAFSVRPTISIKSGTPYSGGTGNWDDPYTI